MKKGKIPEALLKWREKLPRGAIMKPKTFEKIVRKAKEYGYTDPYAVAGKAYWQTLKAKGKSAGIIRNPKNKIYIGIDKVTGKPSIFRFWDEPTAKTHGNIYLYAIGPFKTVGDAQKYIVSHHLYYRFERF